MTEMTYTRCGLCNGNLVIDWLDAGMMERRECPCTTGRTPGWSPTGMTANQMESLVSQYQKMCEAYNELSRKYESLKRLLRECDVRVKKMIED